MELWRSTILPATAPFAVALFVLLPAALLVGGRREGGAPAPLRVPLAGGIAVAAGYAVGSWFLLGLPQWPAVSADERLLWLVCAAALVAGLGGLFAGRAAQVFGALQTLLAAGAAWWLLERALEHIYPGREGAFAVAALAAAIVLLAGALALLARRRPGVLTPLLLVATASAAAGVLVLGRTAKLGQLSGALASALAACALVGLWRRNLVLAGGATAAFAFALVGLLSAGVTYNEVPLPAALLIAAAPLMAVLAELPGLARLGCRAHAILRVALVLLPLLGALYLAWAGQPPAYEY